MAAQQSKKLSKANVVVVPTTSVTQSMSAMLVFDEDLSVEENTQAFEEAILEVSSGQITNAVRDTVVDDIEIKEGDYLVIVDGRIKASDKSLECAVVDAVSNMVNDESAVITLFYGNDVQKSDAENIKNTLEKKYDECDVYLYDGGQPVYHYLISVE